MKNLKLNRRAEVYIATAILLWVTSCVNAPHYSDIPEISIQNIQMSRPVPIPGDSIVVVLAFRDGDGDLGRRNDQDSVANLFIIDKRFGIIDSASYSIPNIPQKGSVKDISGEISVNLLSKVYCNPLKPGILNDTLQFEFQVRDRAGHFSNKALTQKIVMACH